MMKVLVTGANGFIGKNLISALQCKGGAGIMAYDMDTDPGLLDDFCKQADFVFHLAGVNRPQDDAEFMTGNCCFTCELLNLLKKHGNTCPVMYASSIHAQMDNPYGRSKRAGEEALLAYKHETGANVLIYRFPNVFGKWCRPNYNSAVATFCYNIARDLPITAADPSAIMTLVYIDDVVDELQAALEGREHRFGNYCEVTINHIVTLGEIIDYLISFKKSREEYTLPCLTSLFIKKLYSTYVSYLPENRFGYRLNMHEDQRGSFSEFVRMQERGQISVNIAKPGITKGNHWHHSKTEKFLVVAGQGVIRFRALDSDRIIEYYVSGEKLEVVDIPPGYIHNIQNLGDTDMATVMWANESFDPEKPDTYNREV